MSDQEPGALNPHVEPAIPAGASDTAAPAAALETRLRAAEQKAQEREDAWLRAKAETENMRKRAQADVASAHKYAVDNLADALLPVRDSLEAALAIENATLESLKNGVELTLRQLNSVFEKACIREINPINEKFDPHRHQALSMVQQEGDPNQVVSVMQKGYLLHDRVLRPALVAISSAKDA